MCYAAQAPSNARMQSCLDAAIHLAHFRQTLGDRLEALAAELPPMPRLRPLRVPEPAKADRLGSRELTGRRLTWGVLLVTVHGDRQRLALAGGPLFPPCSCGWKVRVNFPEHASACHTIGWQHETIGLLN